MARMVKIFIGCLSLVQVPAVQLQLGRQPKRMAPVNFTVSKDEVFVAGGPTILAWMDKKPGGAHPRNKKYADWEGENNDTFIPGYKGNHGNVLQFITNAIIYAEALDIPKVKLDECVQGFLKYEMAFETLPLVINIDRTVEEGRIRKTIKTEDCDLVIYNTCHVDIKLRENATLHYLKKYLRKGCGDEQYDGLSIHLRRPEDILPDYMQPPCEMYADIIERGHFTKARAFGETNPCYEWLQNYSSSTGFRMEFLFHRTVSDDFCEAIGARNLAVGTSTMSMMAIIFGGRENRHLWGMIPQGVVDTFLYYGESEAYFEAMCAMYNMTGYELEDPNYWDSTLGVPERMMTDRETLGFKVTEC